MSTFDSKRVKEIAKKVFDYTVLVLKEAKKGSPP